MGGFQGSVPEVVPVTPLTFHRLESVARPHLTARELGRHALALCPERRAKALSVTFKRLQVSAVKLG